MIQKILNFLFKTDTYDGCLDEFITRKNPQSIVELENCIKEFEKRIHENGWLL